eukprot:8765315-Pyramimonas_sp.AAC.1
MDAERGASSERTEGTKGTTERGAELEKRRGFTRLRRRVGAPHLIGLLGGGGSGCVRWAPRSRGTAKVGMRAKRGSGGRMVR